MLVDGEIHCMVADFGMGEMKSEVCRIKGVMPSRELLSYISHIGQLSTEATLRWDASELLLDTRALTQETDIYAYAMCCVGILSWGLPPWGLIGDGEIKEFVLSAFSSFTPGDD